MGTYFDKTQRLRELCRHLTKTGTVPQRVRRNCSEGLSPVFEEATALDRAALLCKADLLTNMVREKEFTSLQGRIGGIYARRLGEPAAVADAIAEQYLPRFIGDKFPATLNGALLSIADKLDNIVGTFLTGKIPTGSEDPFAARRQASGLLAIVMERRLPMNLEGLIETAVSRFPNPKSECSDQISWFFRERLSALLAEQGIRYDVALAVLETSWDEPTQAMLRAAALTAYRSQPEFEKLAVGQKRVANILKNQPTPVLPVEELMREPSEIELWKQSKGIVPELSVALKAQDYQTAFRLLLGLRPTIDKFFDDVLVMDKDQKVRANRLNLLSYVRSVFGTVADLSKIVIEGE